MAVDDIKKTFWIFTNQSIYELVIKNEERDVWKLYLEKDNTTPRCSTAKIQRKRTRCTLLELETISISEDTK